MTLIRNCLLALGLITLFSAAHAQINADAARALAEKNLCLSCHKVEGKLVGPGFRDVAKKYQRDAEAQSKLIAKIKKGAKGVWGTAPMPPAQDVPDEDLKTVVAWILSLGRGAGQP